MVYAQVAAQAGSISDREALVKAFRAFDGQTFFGPVKYRDDGLNVKAPIFGAQYQGGKVRLVYPPRVREETLIHPYPGWKRV